MSTCLSCPFFSFFTLTLQAGRTNKSRIASPSRLRKTSIDATKTTTGAEARIDSMCVTRPSKGRSSTERPAFGAEMRAFGAEMRAFGAEVRAVEVEVLAFGAERLAFAEDM